MVPLFNKPPKHRDIEYRARKRKRWTRRAKRKRARAAKTKG